MISNSQKLAYDMLLYKAVNKYVTDYNKIIKNKIKKIEEDKIKKKNLDNDLVKSIEEEKDLTDLLDKYNTEKNDYSLKSNERKAKISKNILERKKILVLMIIAMIFEIILFIYASTKGYNISSPSILLNIISFITYYLIPIFLFIALIILAIMFIRRSNFNNEYASLLLSTESNIKSTKAKLTKLRSKIKNIKKELINCLYIENLDAYNNEIKYSEIILSRIDEYKNNIKMDKFNLVGDKIFETVFYYLYNEIESDIESVIKYIDSNPKKVMRRDKAEIPYVITTDNFNENIGYLINDLNVSVLTDTLLDDIRDDYSKHLLTINILDMDTKKDIIDNKMIITNDIIISIIKKIYG